MVFFRAHNETFLVVNKFLNFFFTSIIMKISHDEFRYFALIPLNQVFMN